MASQRDRDNITQQNHHGSLLLRLPSELRNRIYEQACIGAVIAVPDGANIESLDSDIDYTNKHQAASAILHTSRQVRHEALPIFYQHATFQLRNFGTKRIRERLGSDVCDNMRSIQLSEDIAGVLSANFQDWELWLARQPDLFKDLSQNIQAAHLPRLEYVYVEIDMKRQRPLSRYIYDHFEPAIRECYGRDGLFARITTVPDEEVVE